jgi:hypothetical protein
VSELSVRRWLCRKEPDHRLRDRRPEGEICQRGGIKTKHTALGVGKLESWRIAGWDNDYCHGLPVMDLNVMGPESGCAVGDFSRPDLPHNYSIGARLNARPMPATIPASDLTFWIDRRSGWSTFMFVSTEFFWVLVLCGLCALSVLGVLWIYRGIVVYVSASLRAQMRRDGEEESEALTAAQKVVEEAEPSAPYERFA